MTDRVGPFELQGELGRGSAGVVYKAIKPPSQKPLALKVLFSTTLEAGGLVRFRREANALLALDHPGVVKVFETGSTERGQPYIALEYEPGGSLHERLRRGPLAIPEAVSIALRLAEALEHAHAQGILHRDLKPHNVLFNADGQPLITDFGLARAIGRDERITRTGEMLGTPTYMPPEQIQGDPSKIGPASDLYSLGGTLFAMLAGRPPFWGDTVLDVLKAVVSDPVPSLSAERPAVDAVLEGIVQRCLAKSPADRYPDARSLAQALAAWSPPSTEQIVAARQVVWGVRFAIAGVGLIVTAALVLAGWIVLSQRGGASEAPDVGGGPSPTQTARPRPADVGPVTTSAISREEALETAWNRIKTHLSAREWEQAVAAGDVAVRLRAGATSHSLRAIARYRVGRYEDCLKDCDAALRLSPNDYTTLVQRGHAYSRLRRVQASRTDYQRALELRPDDPRALTALGWSLWTFDRDAGGASRYFRRAIEARPTPEALAGMALLCLTEERLNEALRLADEALQLDRHLLEALEVRAAALLKLTRTEEACAAYEVLVRVSPFNVDWHLAALRLGWRHRDRKVVLERARALIKAMPAKHERRPMLVELEATWASALESK